MKRLSLLASFVLLVSLAAGCSTVKSWMPATSSTAGDQMLTQAKQTKVLGKTWNEGQDLVEKGEKLLSKSEQLALDSKKAKLEAEGLIAKGNSLISNSEDNYRVAFGDNEATSDYDTINR